ncbi:hypothetical protein ACFSC4_07440 [Deinococcus malanensis]|uniref:hypothetical protein n=1 Tax=Deinococcus malanensis TaxID=1706855 RepID=UPI00364192F3
MSPRLSLRPTRFGLGFLLLVVLTLIGCVNYGLSLGYGLTFLLSGVWIMTAAPLNRVARGLVLHLDAPSHVSAGHSAPFQVRAQTSGPAGLLSVQLRSEAGDMTCVTLRVPPAKLRARYWKCRCVPVVC